LIRAPFGRSIFPVTQEVLMSMTSRFRAIQGELFSPPVELPQLPPEAYQRMVRLLARMMNGHLQRASRANAQGEVGDE
jgi:hypothetical protein